MSNATSKRRLDKLNARAATQGKGVQGNDAQGLEFDNTIALFEELAAAGIICAETMERTRAVERGDSRSLINHLTDKELASVSYLFETPTERERLKESARTQESPYGAFELTIEEMERLDKLLDETND